MSKAVSKFHFLFMQKNCETGKIIMDLIGVLYPHNNDTTRGGATLGLEGP
jgi:hypothetical protein